MDSWLYLKEKLHNKIKKVLFVTILLFVFEVNSQNQQSVSRKTDITQIKENDFVSLRLNRAGCEDCNMKKWPCSKTTYSVMRVRNGGDPSATRFLYLCNICNKKYPNNEPQLPICVVYGDVDSKTSSTLTLICIKCKEKHIYENADINMAEIQLLTFPPGSRPKWFRDMLTISTDP